MNHIAVQTVVFRQTTRVNMVGWTNNKHANSTAIPVMNIGQYCSICCLCLVLTVSLAVTDHQIRLLLVDLRECCKGMVRSKPSPKIKAISLSARRRMIQAATKMMPRRKKSDMPVMADAPTTTSFSHPPDGVSYHQLQIVSDHSPCHDENRGTGIVGLVPLWLRTCLIGLCSGLLYSVVMESNRIGHEGSDRSLISDEAVVRPPLCDNHLADQWSQLV
jgi:hypothetical protein